MNTDLAKYIDHTNLRPDATAKDIAKLCREAKKYGFASVCVHPCEVKRAAKLLKGSGVKVCTVVGFPLGKNDISTIVFEATAALREGADELDFVINTGALKDAVAKGMKGKDASLLVSGWKAAVTIAHGAKKDVVTKLIIECCNLDNAEKVAACEIAKAAGFDFVKTSTGFGKGGATVEDVKLMRRTVGRKMGVKAAGGIRTKEEALAMIKAGATRLGCSCGVSLVK